mmetsp:Transcript_103338/g.316260  ORF Transcript_103338/g.316260 Transcript_103338/m.316260 type:complete len:302 (-) Transcript_103338:643-1548(-)
MPISLASSLASNSALLPMRVVSRSFKASDRSRSASRTESSACGTSVAASLRLTWNLSPPVRRLAMPTPFSRSRAPSSMRKGTPLRSHSKYLSPGFKPTRSSTCTRMPWASTVSRNALAASKMAFCVSAFLWNKATMTTWMAATAGGRTRPVSSECAMIVAPISRVDTPQDVAHTYLKSPVSSVWYCTSKALAKFCPRKCEVPAWMAMPFCASASIVYVSSAPAKRSRSDFRPGNNGKPNCSCASHTYTSRISLACASASSFVAWAVWPSCHKNSALRKKGFVLRSQRMTFTHWFIRIGKSL